MVPSGDLAGYTSDALHHCEAPNAPLGCFVRISAEDRSDDDSREYRIGRIVESADEFGDVTIEFRVEAIGVPTAVVFEKHPSRMIERCRIAPNAHVVHVPTGRRAKLLAAADDELSAAEPLRYFVQFDGEIACVSENELSVGSTHQDPDPIRQLQRYELHNPSWLQSRDFVVESMAELRNMSYGLEDLVAARVKLLAHQAEVVALALASTECRFLLADEVGLGKTIEAGLILKGLRRRDPLLRVLIVAPASLVHQWQRELDDRFWLRLTRADSGGFNCGLETGAIDRRGMIVSAERLVEDTELQRDLLDKSWGLLVIDEAHHVRKNPKLDRILRAFSRVSERVLVLSATPIQRRANEYLALLRLLDPARYEAMSDEAFDALLKLQGEVRKAVAYLGRGLDPDYFDPVEFIEELGSLSGRLPGDDVLPTMLAELSSTTRNPDRGRSAAQAAFAYVAENYRIERRVVRNRRAHLKAPVPVRELDQTYAYVPSTIEAATIEHLLDYLSDVSGAASTIVSSAYAQALLHAAMSSPSAILALLIERRRAIDQSKSNDPEAFVAPAPPREERARISHLIDAYPVSSFEAPRLEELIYIAGRWRDQEQQEVADALGRRAGRLYPSASRIGRALAAISDAIGEQRSGRVLLFSSWPETLRDLETVVEQATGARSAATFHSGLGDQALQSSADRFQTDRECRVLLCDELGGEGRNFQIADAIVHVDLPWTPAVIEQRIGRVDRIGRAGVVRSVVLFAHGMPDEQLFRIWQDAFGLFTQSMSGMEIALDGIQTELSMALQQDSVRGLANLLEPMKKRAAELREAIEEERYFDQGVVNRRFRDDFEMASERYRDGALVKRAVLRWAEIIGLRPDHDGNDLIYYSPRRFGEASLTNAKVVSFPNMEEALMRSRRRNNNEVRGTFNRDLAVKREDLVFFAPGGDPWTDFIIANCLESDRGRTCAVLCRNAPGTFTGIDFLFTLSVDARPLYRLGFDPTQLFGGQGYLRIPSFRVLVSNNGAIIDPSHPIAKYISELRNGREKLEHMGQRSGCPSRLDQFRRAFPPEIWPQQVERLSSIARSHVRESFDFLEEEADSAREAFAERIRGWRAASQWLGTADPAGLLEYELISAALVEGIRAPLVRVESVSYWMLRPASQT